MIKTLGMKVDNPYSVAFLITNTCIRAVCGLVWLQEQIPKKTMCLKEIGLSALKIG